MARLPDPRRAEGGHDRVARRARPHIRACTWRASKNRSSSCATAVARAAKRAPATRTASRSGSAASTTTPRSSPTRRPIPCAARARRSTCTTAARNCGSPTRFPTPSSWSSSVIRSIVRIRTGCTRVVGRPRTHRRLHGRLRGRGRPHRKWMGSVLALPPPGPVRRTARTPVPPLPGSAGPRAPLQGVGRYPPRSPERHHRVPRRRAGPPRHRAAREFASIRRSFSAQSRPASAIRTGAAAGASMPPKVWRTVSVPLVRTLQRGGTDRPKLAVEDRRALVRFFADDIGRLERLTGRSYNSWLGDQGRGEFASRRLAVAQ